MSSSLEMCSVVYNFDRERPLCLQSVPVARSEDSRKGLISFSGLVRRLSSLNPFIFTVVLSIIGWHFTEVTSFTSRSKLKTLPLITYLKKRSIFSGSIIKPFITKKRWKSLWLTCLLQFLWSVKQRDLKSETRQKSSFCFNWTLKFSRSTCNSMCKFKRSHNPSSKVRGKKSIFLITTSR